MSSLDGEQLEADGPPPPDGPEVGDPASGAEDFGEFNGQTLDHEPDEKQETEESAVLGAADCSSAEETHSQVGMFFMSKTTASRKTVDMTASRKSVILNGLRIL